MARALRRHCECLATCLVHSHSACGAIDRSITGEGIKQARKEGRKGRSTTMVSCTLREQYECDVCVCSCVRVVCSCRLLGHQPCQWSILLRFDGTHFSTLYPSKPNTVHHQSILHNNSADTVHGMTSLHGEEVCIAVEIVCTNTIDQSSVPVLQFMYPIKGSTVTWWCSVCRTQVTRLRFCVWCGTTD